MKIDFFDLCSAEMFAENIDECAVARSAVIELPGAAVNHGLPDTITISQGAVRHNLSVLKIKF